MDKFLEKIQKDLDTKIFSCINGESIVKPFPKTFEEVREKKSKKVKRNVDLNIEESIYKGVIENFLKDNPNFLDEINK